MPTTPNTAHKTVNEAASEAMRAASEATQRTVLSAHDAMQTTRAYLEESIEANRKLFEAYAQGVEAAIKGGFEVQNAALAVGISFFDTSTKSSGNVAQQWTEVTRQAQQAALEAWQAGVGAGDKMLASAGDMAGQEAKGRKRS
jgi:LmbE family N-acetylglucosaminyl deacetylase